MATNHAISLLCRWLIPLTIPFTILVTIGCSPGEKVDPNAVAVVNGESISREDLDLSLNQLVNQYGQMGIQLDSAHVDTLKHKILDSMVAGVLLFQESVKEGIEITEDEVNSEITAMKSQFPSEEMFLESLASQGLTEDKFREQISRNVAIRKFVDEKIAGEIAIPQEVKMEYYETNIERYEHEDQIAARHIVVTAKEDDTPESREEKQVLLADLRERVLGGEDFSALAIEYSEGPASSRGGDLGFFSRGQMVKEFEDAAFAMKPGEVSEVIETQYGFHLIQVYDQRSAGLSSFEEVEGSIEEMLKRPRINDAVNSRVEALKEAGTVEILL